MLYTQLIVHDEQRKHKDRQINGCRKTQLTNKCTYQYPLFIGCHPFSPTNHLLIENHRSLIQICITPSMESTPKFISSASPVMSRFTSSFTCQLISVTITTLIIYHSFIFSLQAQNLYAFNKSFPP